MSLSIEDLRRSAASLLAAAVSELLPQVILVGGNTTKAGFFYDFIIKQPLSDHLLLMIEERMWQMVKSNFDVHAREMMRENAVEMFSVKGQKYRAEAVSTYSENIVPVVQIKEFMDICFPPYIKRTKEISAFKLLRFKEDVYHSRIKHQVTRVEGTAFFTQKELKLFQKKLEKSKTKDHRVLGKRMDILSKEKKLGSSAWFWLPRGAQIKELLRGYWSQEVKRLGGQNVISPKLSTMKVVDQFSVNEGRVDGLISYLEPWHVWLYQKNINTFLSTEKIVFCEMADLFREEISHQLRGMYKRNTFTSDLITTFVSNKKCYNEVISSLHFLKKTVKMLGVEIKWTLFKEAPKRNVFQEYWAQNAAILQRALEDLGDEFEISVGDRWYGPRIVGQYIDCLGCEWKGPYVGINCMHSELKRTLAVVQCSAFGSCERVIAALIEQSSGSLPLWLAPEQVRIVPVGQKDLDFASKIAEKIKESDLRVNIDRSDEAMKVKIFNANQLKIPFTVVIGEKERIKECVRLRTLENPKDSHAEKIEKVIELIRNKEKKERFEN